MHDCCIDEAGKAPGEVSPAPGTRRVPDLGTLRTLRWRDALARLAGPALRLHRFRNLRSAMLYDALSRNRDGGKP